MVSKNLFLVTAAALFCVLKGSGTRSIGPIGPCDETVSLLRQLPTAKVKYEEAVYFKSKKALGYKRKYYALVNKFKQKDSLECRKNCIREMLVKDSISHLDTVIFFKYLPVISSTVTPCNEMRYSEFLSVMLMNLDNPNNDSTLDCDPDILWNRRLKK